MAVAEGVTVAGNTVLDEGMEADRLEREALESPLQDFGLCPQSDRKQLTKFRFEHVILIPKLKLLISPL